MAVDPGCLDLVVVSVGEKTARCRFLRSDRTINLRVARSWDLVPGEIASIRPAEQWQDRRQASISCTVVRTRLDVAALDLVALRLTDEDVWNPQAEYWGEDYRALYDWEEAIIARGPRTAYEMEQVLPGEDPTNFDSDPILDSNDLKAMGDLRGARHLLMSLLEVDLRCLDAHAHLGHLVFDDHAGTALRHYEVGVCIGEISLGHDFDGVLPWGLVDNRPFLRCMHGYGLSLWRVGRFEEAEGVFDRMLWLNPSDNQGVRALIDPVRARASWEPD